MAKAKTSITTENRSGSAADAAAKEKRTEMPFSDLHPFEGHPFKVLDDELMEQTVESIKQIGVVSPLIVRPDPEGGFEILSGHRRLHAAQLAGLETVPVIVKEMDDDAAIIFMVDSNLQRENILPSERAFSYKMKLEAMKHQGQRKDLTSEQFAPKLSTEIIGEAVGMSKDTVKRYIRLTNLIPEILDMVDEKKIAFNPAVELSYLKPSEQKEFLEAMDYAQASPSLSQAQRLKKLSQEGGCTLDAMCEVMNEVKKDELDHVTIKNEVLRKYFPKYYTPQQMQDTIIRLLEKWQRSKQRDIVNGYNAWKRHHQAKAAQKSAQMPLGKQSIKELIGQNQGVSSIPIEKTDLKGFEQVARKYGVDYAITKDQNVIPPKYTVFFKAKDADALTSAFEEFTNRKLKAKEKPSVLEQLNKLKELVAAILPDKVRHKSQERDL